MSAHLLPALASFMLLKNKTFYFSRLRAFYQKLEFLKEFLGTVRKSGIASACVPCLFLGDVGPLGMGTGTGTGTPACTPEVPAC